MTLTHDLRDRLIALAAFTALAAGAWLLLENIGADFLICPDNTVHQAFQYVESRSPLPWLHIAEMVTEEAKLGG